MASLCGQFMTRLQTILDDEGVTYNNDVIAGLIGKYAPDWRRVLNEAQRHSISGKLDTGALINDSNSNYSGLFPIIKDQRLQEDA